MKNKKSDLPIKALMSLDIFKKKFYLCDCFQYHHLMPFNLNRKGIKYSQGQHNNTPECNKVVLVNNVDYYLKTSRLFCCKIM
jgi:hypothetical protein